MAAAEAVAKAEGCALAALLKAEGVWFRVEPGPEEEGHGRGPAWIGRVDSQVRREGRAGRVERRHWRQRWHWRQRRWHGPR